MCGHSLHQQILLQTLTFLDLLSLSPDFIVSSFDSIKFVPFSDHQHYRHSIHAKIK